MCIYNFSLDISSEYFSTFLNALEQLGILIPNLKRTCNIGPGHLCFFCMLTQSSTSNTGSRNYEKKILCGSIPEKMSKVLLRKSILIYLDDQGHKYTRYLVDVNWIMNQGTTKDSSLFPDFFDFVEKVGIPSFSPCKRAQNLEKTRLNKPVCLTGLHQHRPTSSQMLDFELWHIFEWISDIF